MKTRNKFIIFGIILVIVISFAGFSSNMLAFFKPFNYVKVLINLPRIIPKITLSPCSKVFPDKFEDGKKINFIFGFVGMTQEEIDKYGFNIAKAQFFRSQVKDKTNPLFGFVLNNLNFYQTRAGLFEIEPFKSNLDLFRAYYVSTPIDPNSSDPYKIINDTCSFLNGKGINEIFFLSKASTNAKFNTWRLEELGTAFNHEIGHSFGLFDEYYTDMTKNDLSATDIVKWNTKIPNCDYNHPLSTSDYSSGKNYCTKWCSGVDSANYKKYSDQRSLYDSCEQKLENKPSKSDWMSFCQNSLDFNGFFQFYGFYQTIVINGNPGYTNSQTDACSIVFNDSPDNSYYQENIQSFCNRGSLFNIWDLNIGTSCQLDSGCYAGCGGFGVDVYPNKNMGAFGDAFRPYEDGIMGGGAFDASGPDFVAKLHQNDSELPGYGKYDEQLILNKIKEMLK